MSEHYFKGEKKTKENRRGNGSVTLLRRAMFGSSFVKSKGDDIEVALSKNALLVYQHAIPFSLLSS